VRSATLSPRCPPNRRPNPRSLLSAVLSPHRRHDAIVSFILLSPIAALRLACPPPFRYAWGCRQGSPPPPLPFTGQRSRKGREFVGAVSPSSAQGSTSRLREEEEEVPGRGSAAQVKCGPMTHCGNPSCHGLVPPQTRVDSRAATSPSLLELVVVLLAEVSCRQSSLFASSIALLGALAPAVLVHFSSF
jgi:hypothetical protein